MSLEKDYPTKKLLLEHPLYEMDMYLYTEKMLRQNESGQLSFRSQDLFNTYWNANKVALRNLMPFFGLTNGNGRKSDISLKNFSIKNIPEFSEAQREEFHTYHKAISKAVDHITSERFAGLDGVMLDEIVIQARIQLYPVISKMIVFFLNALKTEDNIMCTYKLYGSDETGFVDISAQFKAKTFDSLIERINYLLYACDDAAKIIKP